MFPSINRGDGPAISPTTSQAPPVRNSFFAGDMIDGPIGPGDCAGWHLIDDEYHPGDPFLDWPEYFLYDADRPSSVPADGPEVEDVSAEQRPIDPTTIRVGHVGKLKPDKGAVITTGDFTLAEIVNSIRTSTKLQELTQQARQIIAAHGRDSKEYGDFELSLPGFLPSVAVPVGTRTKALKPQGSHTGLYGFDLDEPRSIDIDRIRGELRDAPGIAAFGLSLGADGMWCLVAGPAATTEAEHKAHWTALASQLPPTAKATSSGQSKNFNRFRAMAFDPDCWLAESVTPLPGAIAEELAKADRREERKAETKTADPGNYDRLTEREIGMLGELPVPPDYNDWLGWLATLKAAGFSAEQVEEWSATGPVYVPGEVLAKWNGLPEDFGPDARQRYRRAVGGGLLPLIWPSRDNLTDTANFHRLAHFNSDRLVVALPEPTDPSEVLADIYGIDSRGMLSSAEFAASVLRTGSQYLATCYVLVDKGEFALCAAHARKLRDVGAPERLRQVAAGALGEQREFRAVPVDLVVRAKADIDADLEVIGTPGGVLHLRTGEILPPTEARKRFVFSSTGVIYDPLAQHSKVDEILPHPAQLQEGSVELYRSKIIAYAMLNRPAREFVLGSLRPWQRQVLIHQLPSAGPG